jgi:CRISPR-associated DxTHG motif protein
MILLSIIGTGNYCEVTYRYGEKVATPGKYVIGALLEFLKVDNVLVAMTRDAADKHENELKNICVFEKISIPDGRNEKELWDIFNAIALKIPEDSELVLDVTHGFRSLPMLMLAVTVYLQVAKNIKVKHILYGAFDAKDENGIAPVFELKPFIDIISWSFATDYFIKMGKANKLKTLTEQIQNRQYRVTTGYKPKGLKNLGNKLEGLSNALSSVRIMEALEIARLLPEELESSKNDVEHIHDAKPLAALFDKISETFGSMIVPKEKEFEYEGLKAQAEIMRFYLQTGQYQQAITLARELLVTRVVLMMPGNPIGHEERETAEAVLNGRNENLQLQPSDNKLLEDIINVWQQFNDLRNDINHAGMRQNPADANKMINNIKDTCGKVIEFFCC